MPNKYIIAIENKIDAKEGKRQLSKYTASLEKYYSIQDDYHLIKIFLSPKGTKPSADNSNWKVYTYYDVLSILNDIYASRKHLLSDEAKILIDNYIKILNSEIMDNQELKNLCNEIYKKHKKALDLIFENKESIVSMASSICVNKLNQMNLDERDAKILSHKGSNVRICSFFTQKIIEKCNKEIEAYYDFDFWPDGEGIKASLVLHVYNLNRKYDESIATEVNKFASKNKIPDGKDWVWKRIWGVKTKSFTEFNSDQIEAWVNECWNKIKKYEDEVLKAQ